MPFNPTDVIIIGAGVSGLLAATALKRAGLQVTVLEKSRGLGGRMATRRFAGAVFDHGAQYFTARSGHFQEYVESWVEAGVAQPWFNRIFGENGELISYRGAPTMNAVGKYLAEDLDVQRESLVSAISHHGDHWKVQVVGKPELHARSVIMTAPPEQGRAMLEAGGFELPPEISRSLHGVHYAKSITVMAVLDGPSGLPEPGTLQPDGGEPLAWVADNQMKGISPLPCLTIQSGAIYAQRCFDFPDDQRVPPLLDAVRPHIKANIIETLAHRWRFAFRREGVEGECVALPEHNLWFAGDSFIGARVEGAALSGLAAADGVFAAMRG